MEKLIKEYEKRIGKIPSRYVPKTLTLADLKKQLESIEKKTERPILKSAVVRRSSYTQKAETYFGKGRTSKEDMAKSLSKGNKKREEELMKGFNEIYDKGIGAYYSSGSRPNVSAFQWGMARVFSVIFGGRSRAIDADIVKKYRIPNLKNV